MVDCMVRAHGCATRVSDIQVLVSRREAGLTSMDNLIALRQTVAASAGTCRPQDNR